MTVSMRSEPGTIFTFAAGFFSVTASPLVMPGRKCGRTSNSAVTPEPLAIAPSDRLDQRAPRRRAVVDVQIVAHRDDVAGRQARERQRLAVGVDRGDGHAGGTQDGAARVGLRIEHGRIAQVEVRPAVERPQARAQLFGASMRHTRGAHLGLVQRRAELMRQPFARAERRGRILPQPRSRRPLRPARGPRDRQAPAETTASPADSPSGACVRA